MTWYNILFLSVFAIFFLKSIISWIAGDIDLDVDLDGDIDTDIGSVLSFKGVLHFLLGFSSVLAANGYEQTHVFTVSCHFSFATYLLAIGVGLLVMFALFYAYKETMKLNSYSTDNFNFNGCKGKIYLIDGNNQYQVLIESPNGVYKKTAFSEEGHKIGEEITIIWDKEKNRYKF